MWAFLACSCVWGSRVWLPSQNRFGLLRPVALLIASPTF